MKFKKILGREPAVFLGLVASVLLALIRFIPFTPEVFGTLNAAVLAGAGFATAAMVSSERALPALVGLVQAVFAVFLAYGSPVPESTQTGILALIGAVGAFFVRQNVDAPMDRWYGDRIEASYDNGYQAGQDDVVRPELGSARETGAHSHTDVMPSVGTVRDEDNHTTRRRKNG